MYMYVFMYIQVADVKITTVTIKVSSVAISMGSDPAMLQTSNEKCHE